MSVNDVLAVSELASTCYSFLAEQEGFSDSQLKQLLDTRCSIQYVQQSSRQFDRYVLELDGRIVGLVAIEENDLAELWVLPERHREGIGTLLFQEGERLIAGRGHRTLTVRTTGYAVPFYKAMGAHVVGRKPCEWGPLKGWELTYLEKPLVRE
jgi:ribosomal protein S18 acetylase RimI-like enzyme